MVIAALANCRPLSGMLSIRSTSTTPPTDDEVRSMSGVSPRTSTASASDATFRVTGMSRVWPTLITMPLLSILLKPWSSAVMS